LLTLPADDAALDDARRERLHELMSAASIPRARARIEAGAPHEVLRDMMERGEADLVVMGAVARGRIKEALIGHTAERVLHAGGADVLVVKAPVSGAGPDASCASARGGSSRGTGGARAASGRERSGSARRPPRSRRRAP